MKSRSVYVALTIGLGLALLAISTSILASFDAASLAESDGPIQANTVTGSGESQAGQASIVADHSVVAQFGQIPKSAIDAAAAKITLFMHQSTGGLIDDSGLGCLAGLHGDPANYLQECITYANNRTTGGWPWYDKSKWAWDFWLSPQADAIAKTDQFVDVVHARAGNYQVIGMKFCYVDGWNQGDNVAYNNNHGYYITKMEALEQQYPGKVFIYATSALWAEPGGACGGLFDSCQQMAEFNQQVRAYARAHNKPLYDIADIESHDRNGNPCTVSGYEGMCADWYDSGGGHPNVEGAIQLAKGFWWLMARMGGWTGESPATSQKTASTGTPAYGQTVTYTVVIQGLAASPTVTITMTDVVPPGLSYLPGTLTATQGIVTDTMSPSLRWWGLLTPTSAVTLTYAVTVSTVASEAITNSAVIVAPDYPTITRTATIYAQGLSPLSYAKNAILSHDPAWPGDHITYTIAVRNSGPADAVGVHITDTLPSQVIGPNVDVTYTIAAGDALTLTLPVTLSADAPWGATITNTAYYRHGAGSGSAEAAFTIVGPPQLSITKSVILGPSPVRLGQPVTYAITLSNTGQGAGTGVVMTDILLTALTFGGWVEQNGATLADGKIMWTGDVSAQTRISVAFTATLANDPILYGQTITNTVYFESANTPGGHASTAFAIPAPDLSHSVKRVSASTVEAGGLVTYTILLSNTGSLSTTVRYTDTLPTELEWLSGDLNGEVTLDAGYSGTLFILTQVKVDVESYAVFHNTVDISDGYHPILTCTSPLTAVGAFRTFMPLTLRDNISVDETPKWGLQGRRRHR